VWRLYIPTLLGQEFDCIVNGPVGRAGKDSSTKYDRAYFDHRIRSIAASGDHDVCDALNVILVQEVQTESLKEPSSPDKVAEISTSLQAVMEEIRRTDERFLASLKAQVCAGLRIFEKSKAGLLPSLQDRFDEASLGMIHAVEDYVKTLAQITTSTFGETRIVEAKMDDAFSQGGLSLVGAANGPKSEPKGHSDEPKAESDNPPVVEVKDEKELNMSTAHVPGGKCPFSAH